jgi:hypothetical protein
LPASFARVEAASPTPPLACHSGINSRSASSNAHSSPWRIPLLRHILQPDHEDGSVLVDHLEVAYAGPFDADQIRPAGSAMRKVSTPARRISGHVRLAARTPRSIASGSALRKDVAAGLTAASARCRGRRRIPMPASPPACGAMRSPR